jgi:4-hydroxy-tetrahydrodipicolinate synthase
MSFEGVIPPVVTPFSLEGDLDLGGLESQIKWLSGRGLAGILVAGSTGEAPLLGREERRLMMEKAAAVREQGTVLMVGTGAQSTRETVVFTVDAGHAGADAALVFNPFYFKGAMTVDAHVAHFEAVADASPVPVLLYNVPLFTGLAIPPEAVERLAQHENIVGMKDSSGDLRTLQTFLERTPPEFQVLNGSALITGMSAAAGATGVILAMANVVPDLCVDLFDAGAADDMDRVRELQASLNFLTREIQGAHGIPGIKVAAELLGGFGGFPRSPIRPATEDAKERIRAALAEAGSLPASS